MRNSLSLRHQQTGYDVGQLGHDQLKHKMSKHVIFWGTFDLKQNIARGKRKELPVSHSRKKVQCMEKKTTGRNTGGVRIPNMDSTDDQKKWKTTF